MNKSSLPTLLLSSRYTEDSQRLWQAAIQRGWAVERIHRNGELQREHDFAASGAEVDELRQFVERVLNDPRVTVPRATVIDAGVIQNRGWAVVELNSAWGAGLYGCDPVEVLEVLRHAAIRQPVNSS